MLLIELNLHWALVLQHTRPILLHFHGFTCLLILFISRFSIVTDTAPDREREDQTHTSTILSKNASHVFSRINTINCACLFLVWVQMQGIGGFVNFLLLYHDQIWTHVSVEHESHVVRNEQHLESSGIRSVWPNRAGRCKLADSRNPSAEVYTVSADRRLLWHYIMSK